MDSDWVYRLPVGEEVGLLTLTINGSQTHMVKGPDVYELMEAMQYAMN